MEKQREEFPTLPPTPIPTPAIRFLSMDKARLSEEQAPWLRSGRPWRHAAMQPRALGPDSYCRRCTKRPKRSAILHRVATDLSKPDPAGMPVPGWVRPMERKLPNFGPAVPQRNAALAVETVILKLRPQQRPPSLNYLRISDSCIICCRACSGKLFGTIRSLAIS